MKTLNSTFPLHRLLGLLCLSWLILYGSTALAQATANGVVANALGETPAGTVITSQAFADYEDILGNPQQRVYSNSVQTIVSAIYGVEVQPPTASHAGNAGDTSSFAFAVLNIGNDTDTMNVSRTGTLPSGWTSEIVVDENADGVYQSTETSAVSDTGPLEPGMNANFLLLITVPGSAANGASGTQQVSATSQGDGSKSSLGDYTLSIRAGVLRINKGIVDTAAFRPGDVVTYVLDAENSGSAQITDVNYFDLIPGGTTYVAGSMRIGPRGSSYDTATPLTDAEGDGDLADYNSRKPGAVAYGPATIAAGVQSQLVFFQVQINGDVSAGVNISNIATGEYTSGTTPTEVDSNPALFTVDSVGDSTISPSEQTKFAEPGEIVRFSLTINNTGNATDTINLTASSTRGYSWTFYQNGNLLEDSDSNGNQDTGPLPAGSSLAVEAVASIPSNANDGDQDTTTVRAQTSIITILSGLTETATLTTNIQTAVLQMAKSVSPTGNQPPGTVLTYTLELSNNGGGTARNIIVSDPIPEWTSYQANSIETRSGGGSFNPRTDADDGDGARFDGSTNSILSDSLDVGPGGASFLRFKVTID